MTNGCLRPGDICLLCGRPILTKDLNDLMILSYIAKALGAGKEAAPESGAASEEGQGNG